VGGFVCSFSNLTLNLKWELNEGDDQEMTKETTTTGKLTGTSRSFNNLLFPIHLVKLFVPFNLLEFPFL